VVVDIDWGTHDGFDTLMRTLEVRDEHLDPRSWCGLLDRLRRCNEMSGAAVEQIVAVN
jgi:hypothetical protein